MSNVRKGDPVSEDAKVMVVFAVVVVVIMTLALVFL